MRRSPHLPRPAFPALDNGRMARPGPRRIPLHRRHPVHRPGPRRLVDTRVWVDTRGWLENPLVDTLRRTPSRAGRHPGMQRTLGAVLPRPAGNQRTDGNLPHPRLRPRRRTAGRVHRHRRPPPRRRRRRVGGRPHHRRLRPRPVLPRPAGNQRTNGNLPQPGARPDSPTRTPTTDPCSPQTIHLHHPHRRLCVRNTHRPNHSLLGKRQRQPPL